MNKQIRNCVFVFSLPPDFDDFSVIFIFKYLQPTSISNKCEGYSFNYKKNQLYL